MQPESITIPVKITPQIFRRFALFNLLWVQKAWRRPAVFALLLSVFACICFVLHERQGAVLLGSVLLAVGLGLPLAYFASFLLSINRQFSRMKLKNGRHVYTLVLDEDGVTVSTEKQRTPQPWSNWSRAWRTKHDTYLYLAGGHAFVLPEGQADAASEAVWAMLKCHLGSEKAVALR